ncbi:TRAP transporter small permease [Paenalcaligenes hominis]|uniref:TRAP transporter small permease n=1 Tax=Paenalcaligenes hominis TaxID=643674 RepID=UPI003525A5F3
MAESGLEASAWAKPTDLLGRFLYAVSVSLALVGAAILFLVCVLSTYSVIGRWLFSEPVLGDVELVQMGAALSIAACLPYAQMRNAHLIVDFFTLKAPPKLKRGLDIGAALLLALCAAVLGWRSVVGGIESYHYGESSMILAWPVWWSFLMLGPGFFLLCMTSLYTAGRLMSKPKGTA